MEDQTKDDDMLRDRLILRGTALCSAISALPLAAYAQQQGPGPAGDTTVGALWMFTLGIVLLIAVIMLAMFLRKRSNRRAMQRALNDE